MSNQTKLTLVPNSPLANVDPESFYQTPSLMALKAIRAKLTAADWALWSYLQIIDPYGDRMVELPNVSEIAEVIAISERQVKRSLAKLEELELYHWEPVVIRGQNLAGKKARELCNQKKQSKKSAQRKMTDLSSHGQDYPPNDEIVISRTDLSSHGQICPKPEMEPLPDKSSDTPQTKQTYSNFIHTLSDDERENFEKFVREQWKKITAKNQEAGQEIVSMERFLSNPEDLNNWWEKFLKSAAGKAAKKKAIATSHDWRNEECFDKWIWEAFNRGYEWVHENEAERSSRQNFHDWAFAVNAFEGVCL